MKTLINDNYKSVTLLDWERTLRGTGATRSEGGNRSLKLTKEDFEFDWDNADVMTSHLAEAVIVPVKLNKEIALRSVVMEGNKRKKETTPVQLMLYACKIYKTGKTRAYILSYAPDRDYINACEEKGEEMQLHSNPQGSNFSGILFYSSIYGEISHGIRYENGRKRYYIVPRSEKNIGFIEQYRSEHCDDHECHNHVKMAMEFITVNTATRSTYSNNSEGAEMLICMFCGGNAEECTCLEIIACGKCKKDPCECEEIDDGGEEEKCVYCAFPITDCHCNNTPSWGNDDYNNSHGPSPDPYPENKPGSEYVPGGNGNQEQKLTATEIFNKIGKVDASITGADIQKLQNSIYEWYNSNKYNKAILDILMSKNPNLTFSFTFNINVAGFKATSNTIMFYNVTHINNLSIGEELIHATQFHEFYNDNKDVKRKEMEAKAIYDIINCLVLEDPSQGIPSAAKYYDKDVVDEYIGWIVGTNYADYKTRFESWLEKFNHPGSLADPASGYKMFDWMYNNYFKKIEYNMRRTTLSLIVVLWTSVQIWGQNDVFVKEINRDGSRIIYKHTETFNRNKDILLEYSKFESAQLVESAYRIMDMELAKVKYLDAVKKIFYDKLLANELFLLYNNKVRLFYTIDNEGNIYDVFFSMPLTAEQYIEEKLLERIVKLIMDIEISIKMEQYRLLRQQSEINGSNIWTKMTITHGYWKSDN